MSTGTPGHEQGTGDAALAASPPADGRSHQPEFAPVLSGRDSEPDPDDTSSILHGAAAITGKASWSAARVAQASGVLALYEIDRKQRAAREAEEARQLEHLATWNAQLTEVGGVRMTNAEAQAARRRVLTNADAYVDQAIARGELQESDRDAFKRWTARKIELEDKRGRGTITAAEAQEEAESDRTRAGKAVDRATGIDHRERGIAPSTAIPSATANATLRSDGLQALGDYDAFQARAASPAARPEGARVAAKVLATGLDL